MTSSCSQLDVIPELLMSSRSKSSADVSECFANMSKDEPSIIIRMDLTLQYLRFFRGVGELRSQSINILYERRCVKGRLRLKGRGKGRERGKGRGRAGTEREQEQSESMSESKSKRGERGNGSCIERARESERERNRCVSERERQIASSTSLYKFC